MADVLESWKAFGFSEAYEVVKVAEVVMDEQRYRVEVLKCYQNPSVPYCTSGYIKKTARWEDCGLPWTARDTADGALAEGLGFLMERRRQSG